MAIFTAIGAAIAGALFTSATAIALATSVIAGGLALGAGLLWSYLNRPKTRPYAAVQGTVQFGADVSCNTVYGTAKVKGHRVFYAKWGEGNKRNADVFALANGRCDGLEPDIYFYGKKYALTERTIIDNEAAHYGVDGFENLISIRFYDGRPGQGVDTKLVTDTAALGKNWKSTSVGAGICYVVVERVWDSDKFKHGRPEFEFVLRGLRLYDPREDDTAGGSGDQRIVDPSTWTHQLNPAIQRLNYCLGLKGLASGRTLIGMGKAVSAIDVASHIAAANVCDTERAGKPTYICSLWVQAEDDHTEILKEFEDSMAGYAMNRNGFTGVIAGAPQIPAAEITAGDIRTDEPQRVSFRKSAFDLYNVLSGQFTSKESHWKPESLKTIKSNTDITADGRQRQASNDFLQVSDPDIAQYLLNIRYRQNRKGGSATLPVSRRMGFKAPVGVWVTYVGRSWLVTGRKFDARLRFTLTLAETGADIYDDEGIPAGPVVVPPPAVVNPSLLSTVQNFAVEAGMINGPEGYDIPVLRFTWTPPDDPTIVAVRFEYSIDGDAKVFRDQTADPEAGEYFTSKDVISGRIYVARATITTVPDRLKSWTTYATTPSETGNASALSAQANAYFEQLRVGSQASIHRLFDDIRADIEALAQANNGAYALIDQDVNRIATVVGQRIADSEAQVTVLQEANASLRSAIASFLVNAIATTPDGSAEALFGIVASAMEGGAGTTFSFSGKASFLDVLKAAGFYIDIFAAEHGGLSRIRLVGDQVYFENGQGVVVPAFLLTYSDEPVEAPIVGGEIKVDLTSRQVSFYTDVDQDAVYRRPSGAKPGMAYRHYFRMDGAGGHTITFHADETLDFDPVDETANILNIFEIHMYGAVPSLMVPVLLKAAFDGPPDPIEFDGHYSAENVTVYNPILQGGVAGDVVVIFVEAEGSVSSVANFSTMSGWEAVMTAGPFADGSNPQHRYGVFAKRLDGSENFNQALFSAGTLSETRVGAVRLRGGRGAISSGLWGLNFSTSGNPSARNVTLDMSGIPVPVAVVAFAKAAGALTMSPTETAGQDPGSTGVRVKVKIYNTGDTVADVSADADDSGAFNFIAAGFIRM